MNDALYIAATGMNMQQKSVDAIANNLANVNTAGFKKAQVNFEDLVHRDLSAADVSRNGASGAQLWQGSGVAVGAIMTSFLQGALQKTGQQMDVAIQGAGFFEVVGEDGSSAYSRGTPLMVDKDGFLAIASGQALKPAIHVGLDARSIAIDPDGTVRATTDATGAPVEVGKIELVRFSDTSGLVSLGGNLYKPTERSGDAIYGAPGNDNMGALAQGYVEGSNVNLVQEMVGLMAAQRAYESSVKVIQASDEMLGMSNNLRK